MTAWALYLVAVSVLLGGAARAAETALSLYGRPTRFVWLLALAGSLAAPFAFAPARVEEAPAPASVDVAMLTPEMVPALLESARVPLLDRLRPPASVDRAVGRVWGVSAALAVTGLFGWFLVVGLAPRRWPRRRVGDEDVRLAPRAGPAVFGLLRPSIVVPEWLLACPAEVQRLALRHEREHVEARDPALLASGAVLAALTPWNPVSWWLFGRLRAAVELDCDRRVLRRGANVHAYGSMLLGIAGRGRSPLPAVALVEPAVLLERRIRAMTNGTPSARRTRTLFLGVACAAAVLMACSLDGPTEPVPADVPAGDENVFTAAEVPRPEAGEYRAMYDRVGKLIALLKTLDEERETGRATLEILVPTEEHGIEADNVTRARAVVKELLEAQTKIVHEQRGTLHLKERAVRLDTIIRVGEVVVTPIELRAAVIEPLREKRNRIVLRDRAEAERASEGVVHMKSPFAGDGAQPLMLIDGRPATLREKSELDPARIDRIEVLKGAAAERLYGEAGKNGVILIKTK